MGQMSLGAAASSNSTGGGSATAGLLQQFDDVMATAEQYSAFDKPGDAASYLQTGWQYIQYGEQLTSVLGDQIERRNQKLAGLEAAGADPKRVEAERAQIDLLTQLRDRIQESTQRVRDILLGNDRRRQEEELLERQRLEQAAANAAPQALPPATAIPAVSPTSDAVASRYAAVRPA